MNDDAMVERLVQLIASGTDSRAGLCVALGVSPQRCSRLLGMAIQDQKIEPNGRDRFQSPRFKVRTAEESVMIYE